MRGVDGNGEMNDCGMNKGAWSRGLGKGSRGAAEGEVVGGSEAGGEVFGGIG